MSIDRKNPIQEEDNSFFDSEYKKYTSEGSADSCATGSLTLDDLTAMYGTENTRMLKDYETASLNMSELTRSIHENTDAKIESLQGQAAEDVRSDYEFDPDEVTIGEMIRINEEIAKKQKELSEESKEPYLANVIAAFPGEETEQIAVISIPNEAIASDESPFISVDDIRSID